MGPPAFVSNHLSHLATGFYAILTIAYERFLQQPRGFVMTNVRLFYTPTIRANDSVCMRSETDDKLYFNLNAFEQQHCFDTTGRVTTGRRVWDYYTQRSAELLPRVKGKARGLYDKGTRDRLDRFLKGHLKASDDLPKESRILGHVNLVDAFASMHINK